MRILVTGGAGYVGSHAVELLQKSGHHVCVYDNLSYGHRGAVRNAEFVHGDLHDGIKLRQVLRSQRTEAVMHFAAFAYVGESVTDPSLYYQNNLVGSLSLLEAMRDTNVQKLVFSSTTATYGTPDVVPIPETTPQLPINPYGFTKLAVERAIADFAHAYGLGFAALRYFNAAGAASSGEIGEDHTPETHLIPLVLQVALGQRARISVFGSDYPTPDGTCIRDYVHVEDLATAHLSALDHLTPGQGLKLNLGTGNGFSVREVIEACRLVTGHPIPEQAAPRREGDPPQLIADARQAKAVLGWTPRYTNVREIVATAWKWHSSHPRGYGDR